MSGARPLPGSANATLFIPERQAFKLILQMTAWGDVLACPDSDEGAGQFTSSGFIVSESSLSLLAELNRTATVSRFHAANLTKNSGPPVGATFADSRLKSPMG
jgi:hypothetical protein